MSPVLCGHIPKTKSQFDQIKSGFPIKSLSMKKIPHFHLQFPPKQWIDLSQYWTCSMHFNWPELTQCGDPPLRTNHILDRVIVYLCNIYIYIYYCSLRIYFLSKLNMLNFHISTHPQPPALSPGHQGEDHGSQRHPECRQGHPRRAGGNAAGARGGAARLRMFEI